LIDSRSLMAWCLAALVVSCGRCLSSDRPARQANATSGISADASHGLTNDPTRLAENPNADGARTISDPRDLLRMYGIDDSHFDALIDGRPMHADEQETLMRVMFRLRDFPRADIERWAHRKFDPVGLAKSPDAERGQIYYLEGSVTSIEVLRPLEEVAERFELDRYYRSEFLLDNCRQPAVVFTRTVPKAWQKGGPVDQPATAYGVFLKLGRDDVKAPLPMFVAPRIAWHPATALGRLGMDVGLLDDVENQKTITARERECFYQMLAAVSRAKPGQLLREADRKLKRDGKKRFSVVPLFNRPEEQFGRLIAFSGTARRVVRVRVDDPDIVARFGIDHYYQLYLFTEDSQSNPLVFCVPALPKGMPTGDDPRFAEYVRVAGFFFKTWAYHPSVPVEQSQPSGKRTQRWQLAPLLIGTRPVWYPREKPATNTLGSAIAGGLFVLALLGVWLVLWRNSRRDRKFHEETIVKALAMDSGISLEDLGQDITDKPDFSNLEAADASDSGEEQSQEKEK